MVENVDVLVKCNKSRQIIIFFLSLHDEAALQNLCCQQEEVERRQAVAPS